MWRVSGAGGEYCIIYREDSWPGEEPVPPWAAEPMLDRLLSDASARPKLLDWHECIAGSPPGPSAHLDDAVVRDALRTMLWREASSRGEQRAPRKARRRTWIEARLVDMEGSPVPNEHYSIRLPGGQTEEGFVAFSGRVRLDGTAPGTCMALFPDPELEAWEGT